MAGRFETLKQWLCWCPPTLTVSCHNVYLISQNLPIFYFKTEIDNIVLKIHLIFCKLFSNFDSPILLCSKFSKQRVLKIELMLKVWYIHFGWMLKYVLLSNVDGYVR